jgi:hypothetical protein
MLANTEYIYALDMWTVEKRANGWSFRSLRTTVISTNRGAHIPAN